MINMILPSKNQEQLKFNGLFLYMYSTLIKILGQYSVDIFPHLGNLSPVKFH